MLPITFNLKVTEQGGKKMKNVKKKKKNARNRRYLIIFKVNISSVFIPNPSSFLIHLCYLNLI